MAELPALLEPLPGRQAAATAARAQQVEAARMAKQARSRAMTNPQAAVAEAKAGLPEPTKAARAERVLRAQAARTLVPRG